MKFNSKFAFTLAEVLITLGIIGVVAAMTLPTVINNTQQKQLQTALKKAYSNLAQVTQLVILEEYGGEVPVNNIENFSDIVSNFCKHYVNAKRCTGKDSKNGCPVLEEGTAFYNFMHKNYQTFNGNSAGSIGNDALSNTVDGTTIFFDYAAEVEAIHGNIIIAVDVNGWKKKPNRWGHDAFLFQILPNGKLIPMGSEESVYKAETLCSLSSTSSQNGYGCTIKAISEPDYFKNLPK